MRDRLLLVIVALTVALAMIIVYFYPTPGTRPTTCLLVATPDSPIATETIPPAAELIAASATATTSAIETGRALVRKMIHEVIPNAAAASKITFDRFKQLYQSWLDIKNTYGVDQEFLMSYMKEHVSSWSYWSQLSLGPTFLGYYKKVKQAA